MAAASSRLEAQHPVLDDRAHAAADIQLTAAAMRCEREKLLDASADGGNQSFTGILGEANYDEARERRLELGQLSQWDLRAAGERPGDDAIENRCLLAQQLDSPDQVRLGRRMHATQLLEQAVAHATAREAVISVGRVIPPVESASTAVGRRLLARQAEEWPNQQAIARRHRQQRPTPRRGGKPVKHRLGLVRCGVAACDMRAECERERARLAVANVACPGLQVSAPRRRRRTVNMQLDLDPRTEHRHVALVRVGVPPTQAVVDVQHAQSAAPADLPQDVKQAHGVAPARHEDEIMRVRTEEPSGADPLEDACDKLAHRSSLLCARDAVKPPGAL